MNPGGFTPKKICAQVALGVLLMMFVWMVGVFGLQMGLAMAAPELLSNSWMVWLVNDLPLYGLGLPVLLLVLYFIPNGPSAQPRPEIRFGVGKFFLVLLVCVGVSYALNLLGSLIMFLLSLLAGQGGGYTDALGGLVADQNPLALLVFAVLVPAFGEEFIFRYLIRRKLSGASDLTYIVFSALCFGLFHGNLVQGMYAFTIGLVLGWAYVVSGKLWLCMLMHGIFNFMGSIVATLVTTSFVLSLVWNLLVLLLTLAGIVLFFVFRPYALSVLRPPLDAMWPYRPAKEKIQRRQAQVFGPGYLAVFGSYNHPVWPYPAPFYPAPPPYPGCGYSSPYPPSYYGALPTPQTKRSSAAGVCMGNPGMICYLVLSGLLIIVSMVSMVVVL